MSEELKVSFYLRHKEIKKDGTVPIMGRITIGKQMAQFSAKLSVAISLWDIKAARALGKSKVATDLNHALDKIVVSIHTSYEELIERKGSTTPKDVVIAFQGMASGQESLLGYCDKFHKMILQRVGINLKAKSCDQYRIAFKYLREFINAKYNLKDISFGALDYSFIEKFDHYLRIERKFKANSVVGIIGRIKLMIRRAITDDVIVFDPFISFRSEGEEAKPKTLTRQELEQIMTTPLDIPSRYLVRDLFLFSAFTGISFSDLRNLKYSDLTTNDDGTVWVHSKRIKTGVEFHVPLLDLPLKLIDKYMGSTDAITGYHKDFIKQQGYVTAELLKNRVCNIGQKADMLLELFKEHNEQYKQMVGVNREEKSFLIYHYAINHVSDFVKAQYDADDIELIRLNIRFLEDMMLFLRGEKGLSINTGITNFTFTTS